MSSPLLNPTTFESIHETGEEIYIGTTFKEMFPRYPMFINNKFTYGFLYEKERVFAAIVEAYEITSDILIIYSQEAGLSISTVYLGYTADAQPVMFSLHRVMDPRLDDEETPNVYKFVPEDVAESIVEVNEHIENLKDAYKKPIPKVFDKSLLTHCRSINILSTFELPSEKWEVLHKSAVTGAIHTDKSKPIRANEVFIIVQTEEGVSLKGFEMETEGYSDEIIDSNYNNDFKPAYDTLLEFLGDNSSGISVLSGDPGTGKTSLITNLISHARRLDKRFVLLPAEYASALADPSFMPFALTYLKNSILVIEDAELALASRSTHGNTAVSNILNLTDGILGKILTPKVICTINILNDIDEAIERKGRLKMRYHFGPLAADKATALSAKLGYNKEYKKEIVLADIYNTDNVDFTPETKKMGF